MENSKDCPSSDSESEYKMALPPWDFSMAPPSESVSAHSRERSKDYLSSDFDSGYQRALLSLDLSKVLCLV